MDRLIDIKELSETISLAEQTIYNRFNKGGDLPPAIKLGRSLRWRESDVAAWIASKQPAIEPKPLHTAPPKRRRGRPSKLSQVPYQQHKDSELL
ncbi:helix-turn-helix domain-containing protein [Chitinibacter bivalviorum]|uniref:Helix-turn-helix domain-containing protein n=2 Tax=Chitinibacter bivalviorum TaxID=2739434 RepID=A0A7H9BML1_9NEIS|nr:helix-turn-helix domain-containing protein [Chitinibacter bivalviorum]